MHLTLHVWRQKSASLKGKMVRYAADDINPDMSFLEMLDLVNWRLIEKGEEPIAFDHDCREGICGSCGMMINGVANGPRRATATCQLHMRHFKDGDTIYIEPWRSRAFPVLRDLIVDRGAFDRIISRLRARFSHSTSTALRRFQHWRHLSLGSNSTREVTGGGMGRIGDSDRLECPHSR